MSGASAMVMPWVLGICSVLLSLAAFGAILRMIKGPALLDRVLAADVLLAVVASALCVDMAANRHTNNIALVVAITIIGFIGSVTVARFVQDRRRP
ncbi:monovalent cation/H+ antiporter complex subunit F [Sinomonas sp. ASV486]|uniref:Monovalent cation/H+ antiporter complex subunit F n=1 Tax=Sinomonas puerhi TaxID=3238584 RepID=A0AB39L343_9MICC|nr:monovalent cation/H+ antiporter complex subunit F [Sinomonas sp. ASV486]MDQ4491658.1 monovalent cation/H+ antiporter complex subunit F [Sinomonas sp. ASV486]